MIYLRSILAVSAVVVSALVSALTATPVIAQPDNSAASKAAARTGAVVANTAEDIAAIRAISVKWKTLYAAGRYAEIPELYTVDTLVMPRGRPRVEGREQMRKAVGGLAAGRRVDIDLTEREIIISGNHGWVVSDFKVTYSSPNAAPQPMTESGRSLVIFRRDVDGQWRIHRDMDSPAPPAAVATAEPSISKTKADQPRGRPLPAMWNPALRTEVTDCDRMTSSRYDRTRLAPPVTREAMDVPLAIKQCEADLLRFPGDARINFQLGRIYGYAGDKQKTLERREASAAGGNHNAIFLLGYLDWVAAKDDVTRCNAAREMKLAADRGNYPAQITYAAYFNEGRFQSCEDRASKAEVVAFVAAAKPDVDGFFETRLVEHLAWELQDKK